MEGFDLDVGKAGPLRIAAEDVDIWCVTERHDGRISSATEFSGDEELAGVPPEGLVLLHGFEVLPVGRLAQVLNMGRKVAWGFDRGQYDGWAFFGIKPRR